MPGEKPKKRSLEEAVLQAGNKVLGEKKVYQPNGKLPEEQVKLLLSDALPEKKKPIPRLDQSGKTLPEGLLVDGEDSGTGLQKTTSSGVPKTLAEKIDYVKQSIDTPVMAAESTEIVPQLDIENKAAAEQERIGSEQADQQKEEELKKIDNGVGPITNFIAHIDQHFYGLPATFLEGFAVGANQMGRLTEAVGLGKRTPTEEQPTYKIAKWYRDALAEIAPTNPAMQDDLNSKVADATGDLMSLALSGGTRIIPQATTELSNFVKASNIFSTAAKEGGKLISTPPALVGAMQMGVGEFNTAKQAGATDDQAFDAFIKNAGVGSVLEAIPIMKFFKRLDNTTGGGVKKAIVNGATQGVEEMTTEVAQQMYSNVNAANTYDATRKWYDGMVESGGIGFGLGFLLGGMGTSLRKKHSEAATVEEKAEIQKAIDFVEEKAGELKTQQENIDKQVDEGNKEVKPEGETKEAIPGEQIPVSEEVAPEETVEEPTVKKEGVLNNVFGDEKSKLFNYDNPIAEKTVDGIDYRISEGSIKDKKKTYLLYKGKELAGEFSSVNDAKQSIETQVEDVALNKEKTQQFKEKVVSKEERRRVLSQDRITPIAMARGWLLDGGKLRSFQKEENKASGTGKGVKEETGMGGQEIAGMLGVFDNKNGVSVEDAAHKIWENLDENTQKKYDTQDIRNAIIDVVSSENRKDWLNNQNKETGDNQAQYRDWAYSQLSDDERSQIDDHIQSEAFNEERDVNIDILAKEYDEYLKSDQYKNYANEQQREGAQNVGDQENQRTVGQEKSSQPTERKTTDVIRENGDKAKETEGLKDLSGKTLSHISGLGMGQNQLKGTFLSTEEENRYKDRGGKELTAKANVSKPFIADLNSFAEIQNSAIQENFPGKESIEDLSEEEIDKLAEVLTKEFKNQDYDSVYFPQSESQEGELVVFDRNNVEFSDIPPATPEANKPASEKEGPKKERRFPKQIEKADDISAEVKENLSDKTKYYTPISNVQTVEEANNYIKDANLDEALLALKDKKSSMSPRVRVALGEGIIKKANKNFEEATTKEEKDKFLAKAVEAAEFTSEYLTELGQGVQAASIFGRLSWEGLVMHIQKKITKTRNERIEKIAPDLEKKRADLHQINDEIVDKILADPAMKKILEEKLKKISGKLKKKGVDKAIDILEKLKIDTKGKTFDALYGLTAHSINLIITAVQKALKAGSSVVNAIHQGINEYKNNNKDEFDEALLREDLYDQLKGVESEIDPETAIKRGLKDMGTNIREIVKQHYTQADTAKRTLIQRLVKDANLDEADAKDLAAQINDAFTKMATKAKEKALKSELNIRDKVQPKIAKSIDDKLIELTNLGALSQEDFNKIYSEKLGIKELSKEDVAKLKDLSDKIQEADTFAEDTKENFTKENIEKHLGLQKEKQKALNEISDIISDKAPKDAWDTLSVILQGNLLSPLSIVTNVYSNFNLMPLRFLSRLSAQGMDMLYSKATGKPRKIDVVAAAKGYNVGGVFGSKQGWEEFRKGSNVGEINKADIQRSLKPWKSLLEGLDQNKLQTLNERISNLIEGTFGFSAEGMFRSLTLGDRPFQRGAEYGKAFELASLKGLEGEALDKFIMFPDAESAELIRQAGEDATFKQTGGIGDFVAKGVTSFLKWLSKIPVIGGPAKFLLKTQIPYVKTPVNILVETMDYALPQFTFLKAIYYASKKDRVKAFEFLGKAIVGIVLQTVATELFKNGLLSGDPEKEKKERALQHQAFPPNGFNISGYLRLRSGGDHTPRKTDTWIAYEKMGVTGAIFSMKANLENVKIREGKKFDGAMDELLYDTYSTLPNAASTALELGPLQGTNTFLDAVKSGDYDTWISNTLNAITSVAIPNTVTSFNRASRTNLPELRDPDLMTRLSNVMKGKVFMADELPSKVDLWGNKILQTPEGRNPWMYHLFDVTKNREIAADQLSFEIYKLWRNSNSAEAIPAVPSQKISYEGEKFKLNARLYEAYQMEIGQARAELVRAFIESDDYKAVDDFEKIDALKFLYEEGFEVGKEAFWEKHGFEVLKAAQTK